MADHEPTIKIRRPARIQSDGRGRSVWTDPVETSDELELVSTQALHLILKSNDRNARQAIEKAARSGNDGVLARNPASGTFEIIEDEDLQAILDSTRDLPPVTRPADVTLVPLKEDAGPELSLVSTQALRKMLGQKEPQPEAKPKKLRDISGGFDPYNSG